MLTNTASDLGSHVNPSAGRDTYPCHNRAAQIAGVAGEGDASSTVVTETRVIAVTWDTSHFRDVVVVLTSSASDIRRHVSDQPASLREPYTAISAAITATDRLIADGMQWGYLHAASSLTGWGMRKTTLDALTAAPSTQRHSRAARLPPWRCVLGRIAREAGIRRQRGRGWGGVRGGECNGD